MPTVGRALEVLDSHHLLCKDLYDGLSVGPFIFHVAPDLTSDALVASPGRYRTGCCVALNCSNGK